MRKVSIVRAATVPLARRNIFADRRRLAVSVAGVGAALALILLLEGLWGGFRVQISAYEDNVGADLFVLEPGTKDLAGDVSRVSVDTLPTIAAVVGVEDAEPVIALGTVLSLHGRNEFVSVVGSRPGQLGGPWNVTSGRTVRADDEIVMDGTLAEQHGLDLGDRVAMMGSSFRVVGLSSGTRSWMFGYIFTSYDAAARLRGAPGIASFILVRTEQPATVARAIEDQTDLAVLTPGQLADSDRQLLSSIMEGPLNLMVVIAFVAGTIIVALTVYSAIVERIREYGIVKALGARRGRLFRVVLGQTLVLTTLGTIAGYLLFRAGSWLVVSQRPQMWVSLSVRALGGVVGSAAFMALLAAVIPSRRVSRLDPASVYRG